MKNYIYILSLLLISCITSCVQEVYNSHAQGVVVDALNGAPIEGATVDLTNGGSGGGGGSVFGNSGSIVGLLDEQITNGKGKFYANYRKAPNEDIFQVTVEHPDFYSFKNNGEHKDINWADRKNIKVTLMPKAELVIDVRNTKGGNRLDFSTKTTPWDWGMSDMVGPNTFKQYSGKFPSNDTVGIVYTIYTKGSSNPVLKNARVFCPAHQVTTFIIEY